ncbi:MAG: hypothetical protein JWN44_6346 [Myxococcales bacterium]|nr:hypothetical protein [Myxococcales bacterium]
MYALRLLALAGVLLGAACGDPLAVGSFTPALITIKGKITSSTVADPPTSVGVALLWQNDQNPGANYTEQHVDVRAQLFPISFSLDVTKPPGLAVMHSWKSDAPLPPDLDPNMRWAFGTLVVYADDNHNGTLDIVGPNDTSPDRILGATTQLDILYLAAGRPAPAEWIGLLPVAGGFSLVQEPPRRDPHFGECGSFTADGHFTRLCSAQTDALPAALDAANPVELTLSDDPLLARFACNQFWGPLEYADWVRGSATDICDGGACRYCQGYQCRLDVTPAGVVPRC